jgi:hypothetical protein
MASRAIVMCGASGNRKLALERLIDLVHEVHHQDVFSGNGAIGLELVAPVAIGLLFTLEGSQAARNGGLEAQLRVKGRRHRWRSGVAGECALQATVGHQYRCKALRRRHEIAADSGFVSGTSKLILPRNKLMSFDLIDGTAFC